MGQGDQHAKPRFVVPMPAWSRTWPFNNPRAPRAYCPLCDRPLDFCGCDDEPDIGGEG